MTQQQAEFVKGMAKPTVEALGKLGICQCKGEVSTLLFRHNVEVCKKCKKPLVGWKWKPEVGGWFMTAKSNLCLICEVGDCFLRISSNDYEGHTGMSNSFIPILHWEEIERVLEGVGYELIVAAKKCGNNERCVTIDRLEPLSDGRIKHTPMISVYYGKFRQEAVMKAVIALGKKLGEEIKHV